MLVNNAGVAHYMPFAQLPEDKAHELLHVKVVAPTMLTRAAVPGMVARAEGTIINVSGMLAFSGPGLLADVTAAAGRVHGDAGTLSRAFSSAARGAEATRRAGASGVCAPGRVSAPPSGSVSYGCS